jgi:peptidoglycan/LPS O-acetylase OafA/YrhL
VPPHSWIVGYTWSPAVKEQFYLIFPIMWVLTPKASRGKVFLSLLFLRIVWNLSMVYTSWGAFTSSNTRTGFACISCGVLMAIYEVRARTIADGVPALLVALVALTLLVHPAGSLSWRAALYESLLVPPAISLVFLFSLGRGAWLRAFLCSPPRLSV